MEYLLNIDANVKRFLTNHLTTEMQHLLFETCTTTEQVAFFESYLVGHLVDTACILQRWGCDEELCRAGVFHSIYGTEPLDEGAAPISHIALDRRANIRAILGQRTEQIVYLFGAMCKEDFLKNTDKQTGYTLLDRFKATEVSLSEDEYRGMLTLTLADWIEPVTLKERTPRRGIKEYLRASYQEEFRKALPLLPEQAIKDFRLAYGIE